MCISVYCMSRGEGRENERLVKKQAKRNTKAGHEIMQPHESFFSPFLQ